MANIVNGRVVVVKPGAGRIAVHLDGSEAVLSELSSSYPLKLLSPKLPPHNVAVVYALTYGGGLVAGDQVKLEVEVRDGAALVLLTQVRCGKFSRIQLLTWMHVRDQQRSSRQDLANAMPDHIQETWTSLPRSGWM